MANYVNEGFTYGSGPITASANVMAAAGVIGGYVVNSYTAGATVAVFDSAATGTGTQVFAATAVDRLGLWPLAAILKSGCYIVITGTINLTPLVRPAREV